MNMLSCLQPRNIQIYTDNKTVLVSIIMIHISVFSQYKWSAEDQAGMDLDLSKVTTSTARHSPNLEVRSGVLQPGQSYTFTLNVSQPDRGRWGSASLMLLPNNPPHGGRCDLSPESDIKLLETVVTYNCLGNTVVLVLQNAICINIFATFLQRLNTFL